MGAYNALRVYHAWSGTLTAKPMQLLVYMSLVARDYDADPWFGLGHEDLATVALGLKLPDDPDNRRAYDAVLRKVRRHITPLLDKGAIETRDRATFGPRGTTHVVYRLFLDGERKTIAMPAPPQQT